MAHMSAMGNAVGVCKNYLKRQFNARLMRAESDEFKYPSIGDEYRTHNKKSKLKITPNDNRNELDYLKIMMKADARRGSLDTGPLKLSGFLRKVPTLNVQGTNAIALKLRQQQEDLVCLQATQEDDPWLLFLTETYVGKIYRVSNIAYWTRNKTRFANWEATLEPVHMTASGEFAVANEDTIVGPKGARLTKSKFLIGYILAQYIDGDEEEPTRSDCVDLYIENALEKLKAYLYKLSNHKLLK